ncbi:uncharacterized protein LOC135924124 [Gordionus sp. m RMFG-2023]|uniref:uncharacterized protein LOC135924124 n=1 Tax=Gordionus sp. m RMFG-2023 TaxID=3053472 RepID=UPI0031FD0FF1
MNQIFGDIKDAIFYIDDLLITGKNDVDHNHDKIETIANMPEPKSAAELLTFLGMAGYYRKILNNFAEIANPLYKIKLISLPPALTYFNPELPIGIATETSKCGLEAVLFHTEKDGKEKPIAFASRTLLKSEMNHTNIEGEALAIMFTIKRFQEYYSTRKNGCLKRVIVYPIKYLINIKSHMSSSHTFPSCQKLIHLRKNGCLQIHGSSSARCQYSGLPPHSIINNSTFISANIVPPPQNSNSSFSDFFLDHPKPNIISRIPKGARLTVAKSFTDCLSSLLLNFNNENECLKFLFYGYNTFKVPDKTSHKSLTQSRILLQ